MAKRKIQFVANAVKWFDKVNGNTYHSVNVLRCRDGAVLYCEMQYGYGDQYRQTALSAMCKAKWIPAKYGEPNGNGSNNLYVYERENGYPIVWNEHHGLKRECVANGKAG
jgi:hypothetical protein